MRSLRCPPDFAFRRRESRYLPAIEWTLSWDDTGSCELDIFRPGAWETKLKELALDGKYSNLRPSV
jgi:hypothetical protein